MTHNIADKNNRDNEGKMYQKTRYLTAGDKAIVLEFGNEISQELNLLVRKMYYCISRKNIEGIEEMVPTYRSFLLLFINLL